MAIQFAVPALLAGAGAGLLAWFVRVLVFSVIVDFIFKVLVSLGLAYATYNLGSWALESLFDMLKTTIGGAGIETLQLLKIAGVDEVVKILFSALSVRVALSTMKKRKLGFF